jgi:hypothetical protein
VESAALCGQSRRWCISPEPNTRRAGRRGERRVIFRFMDVAEAGARPKPCGPPATGQEARSPKPRRRLRFLGVTGSIRALRPSRSRADVGAGRSSDSRAGAPGLLIERAATRGRLDNGERGAEPLNTRLQRRDRSGFTPDSLFADRRRPRRPATCTRCIGDHTARASGCQSPERSGSPEESGPGRGAVGPKRGCRAHPGPEQAMGGRARSRLRVPPPPNPNHPAEPGTGRPATRPT